MYNNLQVKYKEVVKYIKSFIPTGSGKWNKCSGLDKFLFFMDKLGNPHRGLNYIHVGGTSGKGSTSTFLSSILKESDYKTGLHVSPDVHTIRERAQINGKNISKAEFKKIFFKIKPIIEKMPQDFGAPASFYEILLAIAFIYFQQEKCDFVVLEVGLGGKLDGTNIIDSSYQIITNIGLDHTSILGETKEEILADKQEIIKNNSIVVSGIEEPSLQKIINKKIESTNSKIYFLNNNHNFNFDIKPKLLGLFQTKNASLAALMALKLKEKFTKINYQTISTGITNAYIPGRFQIFSNTPLGIIDGAHNPDKIKALVDSIKFYYPNKKFITIFRYKKRKDIFQSFEILKSISQEIIITGSKRAGDLGWDNTYQGENDNEISQIIPFFVELDLPKAYKLAQNHAQINNLGILVTGSLYMIHEFLKYTK